MKPRSEALLLYRGRRVTIEGEGATIGRDAENTVALRNDRVSRIHARVYRDGESFWVLDLGSRHGTYLNGERLGDDARRLRSGDTIAIAGEALRFVSGDQTRVASRELPVTGTQVVTLGSGRVRIGRDPSNDLVLADPNVSRFHAEVTAGPGGPEVVDLGSRNGTRLAGELVERRHLETGAEIGIGPFRLVFDGSDFVACDDRGTLLLDALDVAVEVKGKRILAPTSLSICPGELVAIIGQSGSGKSTLIRVLAGVSAPSGGQVRVNGDPVSTRLTDVGYVPQDDIVHYLLSVAEALRFSARLRLPDDTSPGEVADAVDWTLTELALMDLADSRIGTLSGGQRKRASVATELLSRPGLLFLDEPATGLDPGLETRMMKLLRELANESRAVTVVTHATKNLGLCDKVAVMGRGGELCFWGAPREALRFFDVSEYDGIYPALDAMPAKEWRQRFKASSVAARDGAPSLPAPAPVRADGRRMLPQTRILTSRYVRLFLRDRRNLAVLMGQVPILALANVALFKVGAFDRPGGDPVVAVQQLFLLVITTIWLGSIDGAREIVKERSVFRREAAVGTRLSAYVASKVIVLFSLVTVQTLLFAGIVLGLRPLEEAAGTYLEVFGLLVATGIVAVAMGLLISALVATEDQAMSINPLVLIPQLLFAGAIVAVQQMGALAQAISYAMFGQWSFAAVGTAVDMNGRIAGNPVVARVDRFGTHFFNVDAGQGFVVLGGFLVAFMAGVCLLLHRRRDAR